MSKLSFCLQATKLHDADSAALTDAIERYTRAGMPMAKAELAAIEDVLADVRAEAQEIVQAVAAKYPMPSAPIAPVEKKSTKPAPSPEETQAKADLGSALADLADLLGKGTRLNMMPEQEAKLMPVLSRLFDAAFRLGYIKFANASKYVLSQIHEALGQGVSDAITIDHLQGAYIAMSGKYRDQGADTAKTVVAVESKRDVESSPDIVKMYPVANSGTQLQIVRTAAGHNVEMLDTSNGKYMPTIRNFKGAESLAKAIDFVETTESADNGGDHVPSRSNPVERDRGKPAAVPVLGAPVPDGRSANVGSDAGAGDANSSQRGRPDGDPRVPDAGAAAGGERGDQRVRAGREPDGSKAGTAGGDFGERGATAGLFGIPPEPIPTSTVGAAARSDAQGNLAAQRAGNKLGVKPGDLENTRATLPTLLPGQQEDVHKAETRWAKPTGYGMLLTNGTGTGKTFSGLGAIRRSVTAGRGNVLVIVPDNKIAEDWQTAGKALDLTLSPLESTKTAGKGVVITTYANMGANDALAKRDWHLVVADEAHMLMQAAHGDPTLYINNLRAITHHPDGASTRHSMLSRADLDQMKELTTQLKDAIDRVKSPSTSKADSEKYEKITDQLEPKIDALRKKLAAAKAKVDADVQAKQGAGRARLMALSATPFAYEKTIDWANGYLFDYRENYPHDENSTRYNQPSPREHFFMQHLGYQMRVNKLTEPDAKVDRGLMQRQFNSFLKKQGSLSGRMLDVPHDYDRRFVLVESAIGNDIDAALDWVNSRTYGPGKVAGMDGVRKRISDTFDYLSRRYLLEAIKAQEAVPIVKAHLALGRKAVVFHDYKKGGGFNPFNVSGESAGSGADAHEKEKSADFNSALAQFRAAHADLIATDFASMRSPVDTFRKAFPDVLVINGDEKPSDLLKRYKQFQDDASGPMVMLVQSDKNKGWSGHDTTGKNQRVLLNLGQPTKPTLSIQQEGRIYRTGQASNAIFRYMNTGTNWEKTAFAQTIAGRASAAENLGMGEQARALKDAYIAAFEESDAFAPGHEGEGTGGKERDRAANDALTEFDRAKAFYWGTAKKNSKTKAQEGKDYFATPEPLGLKMVEWANVRSGEDVLEPSAGHGAIARWFPELANSTAIEPSGTLRPRLSLVFDGKIVEGTFEDHHVVNKYDAIVMNPPFGVGGKLAVEHLAQAATHLRDGGRIVALLPTGPSADKRLEQFLYEERPAKPIFTKGKDKLYHGDTLVFALGVNDHRMVLGSVHTDMGAHYAIPEGSDLRHAINLSVVDVKEVIPGPRTENTNDLHMVADIKLPAVTFERAGTSVNAHVIVLQRGENTPQAISRDLTGEDDINKFFDRIENLDLKPRPESTRQAPQAAPQQPRQPTPVQLPPVAVGALVEVQTSKGKVLRGVLRTDLTLAQAKAIDPFTWKPAGRDGFFIREKYLQGGNTAKEERAVYNVREPQASYDIDLFPGTLDGLQADAGAHAPGKRSKPAAVDRDVRPTPNVLAVRQDAKLPGLYHLSSQLVTVGQRELPVERVSSWAEASAALGHLSRFAVEHFDMLITDKDGKPLAIVGSFKGATTQTGVYPSTVIMEALRIEGAAHAWAVHNHPSGTPTLLRADENLSNVMGHLFHPSSIEYHGIAAVARQGDGSVKWNSVDVDEGRDFGDFTPNGTRSTVPIVEREITSVSDAEAVSSPSVAKEVLARISQGKPGLLLLNAQNAVTGWLPSNPTELATVKGAGFDRLVNSLAEAGAGAVIVSNPDGAHDAAMDKLKARLALMDVRVLDAVDPVNGTSMAERGLLEPDDTVRGYNAREQDDLLSGYDKSEALAKQEREDAARKQEEKDASAKVRGPNVTADQVDLFNPQGSLFKRGDGGAPMEMSEVQKVVARLSAKWTNGPSLHVVANHLELGHDMPKDVRGMYGKGQAYVVARKHRNADEVARTLAHEVIAHYGLREMLGRDDWHKLMTNIQLALASGNKPLREIRDSVRQAYVDNKGKFNLSPAIEADEIAARAVENAIDPKTGEFRPGYGFLKAVWAKLAMALRDAGIHIKFTNLELQGMLVLAQRNLEVGKRTQGGGSVMVTAAREDGPVLARAFHGSPHDFDSFSTDKIGTGEGAQSYGHGLYFAENEGVAKGYHSALTRALAKESWSRVEGEKFGTDTDVIHEVAQDLTWNFPDDNLSAHQAVPLVEQAMSLMRDRGLTKTQALDATGGNKMLRAAVDKLYDGYKVDYTPPPKGALYQVDIPDHIVGKMLLWDKPLSEQPESVKKALAGIDKTALDKDTQGMLGRYSGGDQQSAAALYRMLAADDHIGGQPGASKLLDSLGISGIKYLDNGSRNRPLKDIKREFLAQLPEDADFNEVTDLIGTGKFSPANEAILKALKADDWLGFDHPAQAISAALGDKLSNFDASPALVKAVANAQGDATHNLVVFNDKNVTLTHKDGTPVSKAERADYMEQEQDAFDTAGVAARGQESLFRPDSWSAPDATRTDKVLYELQDGRIDLRRIQEAITKTGSPIEEKFDARLAETLYPGRVARRTELFIDHEVKPMLVAMADQKATMTELADYLIARHAQERNAQVAKVNPDLPDGGAGRNSADTLMTNDNAAAYLAAIPADRLKALATLAGKVDAITKGTRKLLVNEGLEKADTVAAWEGAYSNYVPLFKEESEHPHPQGMGFAVKGPASKRSTGSTKQVTNVLAHVLMQREAAITRAEKNRVGLALYGMALTHPNPAFWTTIKPGMAAEQIGQELQRMGVDPTIAAAGMRGIPTIRLVDPLTQKVVDRPNPIYKNLPGAITLKVNGEDRVLMINTGTERGLRMAEALKNLDGMTKLDLANSIVGKATRWMAASNTQYNPAFGLVNLTRDIQEGLTNLGSTALRGSAMKVAVQVPLAIQGIARELSGGTKSEWSRLFKQFQDDGGKTGFREMFAVAEDRAKAIEKQLARAASAGKLAPGKMAHAVLDLLDGFNTTLENAVRLSAYKVALDKGISRPEAARLARELTVDFNRKGRMGRELGPLYAFFNASMQGAARAMVTLKGPTGAKVLAGGLALGALQALLLVAAGYDDDEIPEFVKVRSLIIPLGSKPDESGKPTKHFISIPLPLGFSFIPNAGRVATELALNGGKDLGKRVFDAIGTIASAFNPLGGGNVFTADGALKTVAPTLIDPLIEIGFNKNFAGSSIEKQSPRGETDNRPGYAKAKESTQRKLTGQAYLGISKAINTLAGGTPYEAGVISPTPERLHYLAETIGGGVLREIEKSIDSTAKAIHGEKVKMSGIPLLGRFYGEVDADQVETSRYYTQSKKLDTMQTSLKAAQAAGDGEAMVRMLEQNPEAALIRLQDKLTRDLAKLNKLAVTTIGDPETTKTVDEARIETMKALNGAVKDLEQASGKVTLGEKLRGAVKREKVAGTAP